MVHQRGFSRNALYLLSGWTAWLPNPWFCDSRANLFFFQQILYFELICHFSMSFLTIGSRMVYIQCLLFHLFSRHSHNRNIGIKWYILLKLSFTLFLFNGALPSGNQAILLLPFS